MCYFGSKHHKDTYGTEDFNDTLVQEENPARWDAIAIVDDFNFLTDSKMPGQTDSTAFWGPNVFYEELVVKKSRTVNRNYFYVMLEKYARYAISSLNDIRHLLVKQ